MLREAHSGKTDGDGALNHRLRRRFAVSGKGRMQMAVIKNAHKIAPFCLANGAECRKNRQNVHSVNIIVEEMQKVHKILPGMQIAT